MKIEKSCWEAAAFRILTGSQQPDHSRSRDFHSHDQAACSARFYGCARGQGW